MKNKTQKHTIQEVADFMGLSKPTARKWIKTMLPEIYKPNQIKTFFTEKEFDLIKKEF